MSAPSKDVAGAANNTAGNPKIPAEEAMNVMATASITLRESLSKALPVANNQLLTVQVPGIVVDPNDYFWNPDATAMAPVLTRINQARLVDGMIPLSKITMGKTGKSVARSYLTALDLLVPVEASISGLISAPPGTMIEGRKRVIKDRYDTAMRFLTSFEDNLDGKSTPKSKLSRYVEKQEGWANAVQSFAEAQQRQQDIIKGSHADPKSQRDEFLRWLQSHSRDFRAAIHARYMDWVVHGYKFKVEFNFGIVDISSGMKRVEASKEALRNLVVIAEDGFTEYNEVILDPKPWAKYVLDKIANWDSRNSKPTPTEIRAEIKRLKNQLISLKALEQSIDKGKFLPLIPNEHTSADGDLQAAYSDAYENLSVKDPKTDGGVIPKANGATSDGKSDAAVKREEAFQSLGKAHSEWKESMLRNNKQAVKELTTDVKKDVLGDLKRKIEAIDIEIKALNAEISSSTRFPLQILDEAGNITECSDAKTRTEPPVTASKEVPSPWTRVTARVSSSKSQSIKIASESASSVSVQAGWGLWKGSVGADHSSAGVQAMSSMANLEVEVSMDCLVVNIERPWLHAELFADPDLDVAPDFPLSPGEVSLQKAAAENKPPEAEYQLFSSFPTAFVVATDVELNFTGDTVDLQGAIESSSTEANVSVGYGPFSLAASHKQSKTKSKTSMENTATGMRISLQAPQIIGWVQNLLPALPRATTEGSRMLGVRVQ
ncbi:MAG: hypothetical protein M1839_003765 [Geoglossum umbratile]|nr:MAG: hypothetical protein M1839_003765 [Geoglossum umbratile]